VATLDAPLHLVEGTRDVVRTPVKPPDANRHDSGAEAGGKSWRSIFHEEQEQAQAAALSRKQMHTDGSAKQAKGRAANMKRSVASGTAVHPARGKGRGRGRGRVK